MYVINCMSQIRSREEIKKHFKDKYNLSLEDPGADENIIIIRKHIENILNTEAVEWLDEAINGTLFEGYKDSLKKVFLNANEYYRDFQILEWLALIDKCADRKKLYASKEGISSNLGPDVEYSEKRKAKQMIKVWDQNVMRIPESDAIPNFPFSIKRISYETKDKYGDNVRKYALEFDDNKYQKLIMTLMNEEYFSLFKTIKYDRDRNDSNGNVPVNKQESETLDKYSWYKENTLFHKIEKLSIECIWAAELCLGMSYTNYAYNCFKEIKDFMSFETWSNICEDLTNITYINFRKKTMKKICEWIKNINISKGFTSDDEIGLCQCIERLVNGCLKKIIEVITDLWWDLDTYDFEVKDYPEVIKQLRKTAKDVWDDYYVSDYVAGRDFCKLFQIQPMFMYSKPSEFWGYSDKDETFSLSQILAYPEVIIRRGTDFPEEIIQADNEGKYQQVLENNTLILSLDEPPKTDIKKDENQIKLKDFKVESDKLFYDMKKDAEEELSKKSKMKEPQKRITEKHYYAMLRKSIVLRLLELIKLEHKEDINKADGQINLIEFI